MIEFTDKELFDLGRRSSKGNQFKFRKDDIWYKADYLGYEGLSEYAVSKLLGFSSLEPGEYVDYNLTKIKYKEMVFSGCMSRDFSNGWNLITLERLFKDTYGHGLNEVIWSVEDHSERLKIMVELVERITGIKDFGKYMNKLMTIDALFLNEDRHTHNMAVLTDGNGSFLPAPVFDNGACLLSDTAMDYPMTSDHIALIRTAKAKTFCEDFSEQLEISEQIYGQNIMFDYGYNDVHDIVWAADNYDESARRRVEEIIMSMRHRYQYLFKSR